MKAPAIFIAGAIVMSKPYWDYKNPVMFVTKML